MAKRSEFSTKKKQFIWLRQDGKCGDCGEAVDYSSDYAVHHVLNCKDGGTGHISNGVLLCEGCHVNVHNLSLIHI